MRTTPNNIQELKGNEIFVFGSNGQGYHYGGAARIAFEKFGAVMGQGHGLHGNSYAIDTMSGISEIKKGVGRFIQISIVESHLTFLVTEIGCGIAGYTPDEIAPLFKEAINIDNIHLPESFWKILNHKP